MFVVCKEYLIEKLVEAGIKTAIITNEKTLKLTAESHLGAVLVDTDTFSKNGSKTVFVDEWGNRKKRVKKYNRDITFSCIIGEYEQSKCQLILGKFLESLDTGIYIDGNHTEIELNDAEWVEEKDSILKAKIAVKLEVVFKGGVYKDTGFIKVKNVEIESIEKADK